MSTEQINAKAINLLKDKNLIFLSTIMKDGSPQVTPVWGDFHDGHILINTAEGRIKHENVLRDPRVSLSVVSYQNPLDMTTIRGKVVKLIPDYDYKNADELTKKYLGKEKYPFRRNGEKRIIFKIKPEKVFVLPELKMSEE